MNVIEFFHVCFSRSTGRRHPLGGGRLWQSFALALSLVAAQIGRAGTVMWVGASATDTNWSDALNWAGTGAAPTNVDNVYFGSVGSVVGSLAVSNVVDATFASHGGTISSLSYTNITANSFQNTLIAPGVTLNITNNTGPFNSALFLGSAIGTVSASMFGSISGAGATLNINNTNANIVVDQVSGSTTLGTLLMTNLDTFIGSINRIAIGNIELGLNGTGQGALYLAKTNFITTSWVGNYSSPYTVAISNAIHLDVGSPGTLGASFMYLGLTNGIFTDSIGVSGVKGGSTASVFAFAPVFTNSSPSAFIRGMAGGTNRVTFWGVGDNGGSGSSSAAANGLVDFTGGTVDAWVDSMLLARDRQNGSAATVTGVLSFTAGNINVNTLTVGDQSGTSTGSACVGTVNVKGSGATLVVNNTLELGHTTLTTGNALTTKGTLNITNGTVQANNIIVGASSTANTINITNGTLLVTNTLATNASGVATMFIANSTLGLSVTADASLKALVQNMTTGGTNMIQLLSAPVFPSYPTQVSLVKWTGTLGGAGFNFGLSPNLPATAPGAFLISNSISKTIDLVLPTSPAPTITSTPGPFAGLPGSSTAFTFGLTGDAPLTFQWFYTNGVTTNQLSDGVGPSGTSTLTGTTTNTLAITNAQVADSGGYFLVITNAYGAVTSAPVLLTISATPIPPTITGLTNQTVIAGTKVTLSASVAGVPVPDLQWLENGTPLDGQTNNTLVFPSVSFAQNGFQYSLVATNLADAVTNTMTLSVIVTPVITNEPVSLVVTTSQSATFIAGASGVPLPTYQWYVNDNPILNATNPTYTILSAQPTNTARYKVVASNAAGSDTSTNVTLTVNSTMAIAAMTPANNATGVCYDTPLWLTFDRPPVLRNAGKINIYNVTNTTTPVDTIDLSQNGPIGQQPRSIAGETLNTFPVIITGDTAAIYPHLDLLTSNQTYYVTIDDGALTDTNGAYFAGISDPTAWRFTTKPTGPSNPNNIQIAIDGTGDFVTVQGAVDFVPAANTTPTVFNIHDGTYTEDVRVNGKNNITFRGHSQFGTLITYVNNDTLNGGTQLRNSFRANGNDLMFDTLSISNATPHGGSQAEAVRVDGAREIFTNVFLASYQDTLLVNNTGNTAYFVNSVIQGDTDFIWGVGTVGFQNCEIRALNAGYNTQMRTDPVHFGAVFADCLISKITGATFTTHMLGRGIGSESDNGNCVYLNCRMDNHISPVGWIPGAATTNTLRYWEYQSVQLDGVTPVDVSQRAPFSMQISAGQAAQMRNLTNVYLGWLPAPALSINGQPAGQTNNVGSTVAFTVGAAGIFTPAIQWVKNGTNVLTGQTNATLTLTNIQFADAGQYAAIVTNINGSLMSSPATLQVPDRAPVANPATYTRAQNLSLKIAVSELIADFTSDPDGDTLSLSSIGSSTNGSTIVTNGGFIVLTSPNNLPETFTYAVVDGHGGSAGNLITVNVAPPSTSGGAQVTASGGQATLTFFGIPGLSIILEKSDSMSGPWTPLTTNSFGSDGSFQFTDTNATNPSAFYRLQAN